MRAIYSKQKIIKEHNIQFYVVKIDDVKLESNRILNVLKDRTWLSEINDKTLTNSFLNRANRTSELFEDRLNSLSSLDDYLTAVGEKIVTINANETIEDECKCRALPLPDMWKFKRDGNPGFDFFNENTTKFYLIYGEGKFVEGKTPYNNAASQVVNFISIGHDIDELPEVKEFIDENTKNNCAKKDFFREFSIAFSIPKKKERDYEEIYNNLKSNKHVLDLLENFNIYAVGVEL